MMIDCIWGPGRKFVDMKPSRVSVTGWADMERRGPCSKKDSLIAKVNSCQKRDEYFIEMHNIKDIVLRSLPVLWLAFESYAAENETYAVSKITSKINTATSATLPASVPKQCGRTCFRGTQGQFCLKQLSPSQICLSAEFIQLIGGPFYCVLFRYKCTRESTCFPGSAPNFYIGNNWANTIDLCDGNARIMGVAGYQTGSCSAEDIKHGTIKWVAEAMDVHALAAYNLASQKIQSENCSSDAELCVCSSDSCNAPSSLEQSDSTHNKCGYALKDYPLPSTPSPPVTINNYVNVIVIIIQFKAPYQMSELTSDLQAKIAMAVANVIGVNASSVSLTFVEVDLRRQLLQQKGVLVNVGLKDFSGPTAPYVSQLNQDAINTQMAKLGLRSVTSVQATNTTQPTLVKPANRGLRMLPCCMTAAFAALTALILTAVAT
jgi:hypothetical protein